MYASGSLQTDQNFSPFAFLNFQAAGVGRGRGRGRGRGVRGRGKAR